MEDLREFLADRDVPCPECRYNLRGLEGPSCPECGKRLDLAELRDAASHRDWRRRRLPTDPLVIAGIIGAIFGLAWPIALAVLMLRGWRYFSSIGPLGQVALVLTALAHVTLFTVYLWWTDRIDRWPREARLALALAAWLLAPLTVLAVGLVTAARLI